ncbi:hypothetical protein [Solitalea lacus]|uniref:hypothetical protein n=1 Tax=Solitalea lacus TaxID=2911172 RepID=UPI001EDA87B6|nr:hypothetical protein [Solitalea lacus]UKJ07808.1 hypothetical protein L2B55_01265 [Solitalea lacus]
MKKILLSLLILSATCITTTIKAQSTSKIANKLFYTELGGPGVLFSANFDGRFDKNKKLGLGYRIGLGFSTYEQDISSSSNTNNYYYETETRNYLTLPIGINYILGKEGSANMFEIGAGLTLLSKKVSIYNYENQDEGSNIIGAISFMYRRQPIDGGFSWRIGFTPIIGTSGNIFPSGAIGIGYNF